MSVWVDPLKDWGWSLGPSCHLLADTTAELHAFAGALGLRREWFQGKERLPHYDLTGRRRARAVICGALELDSRTSIKRALACAKSSDAETKS